MAEEARVHVLPNDKPFKVEIWRAKLLRELGNSQSAVRAAVTVLKLTKREIERWEAHRLVGNVLDDVGEHLGGRNHLMQAWKGTRDPVAGNDLAVAYMRMGCWDKAQDTLNTVLKTHADFALAKDNKQLLDKAHRKYTSGQESYIEALRELVPVPWIECELCKSMFAVDGQEFVLCRDCGGSYRRQKSDCPYCGNDGRVPIELLTMGLAVGAAVGCPTCKAGALTLVQEPDFS